MPYPNFEFKVKGPPLEEGSLEHGIIAVLTKRLGGVVEIDPAQIKNISGFIMEFHSNGKILLKAE